MKTKRTLVTVLAVAISIIALAVEKPKVNVQSLNENQILLTVENPRPITLETTIEDENGDVVYYKQSRKQISSSNKIFDLKNLENGNYVLKLATNGRVTERNLKVASKQITVGKEKEAFTPFFAYNGKRLVITQLNLDKDKYEIEIYNDQGLVYQKNIGNQSPLNSGFDLSELEAGNYKVVMNGGNNYYCYEFAKE